MNIIMKIDLRILFSVKSGRFDILVAEFARRVVPGLPEKDTCLPMLQIMQFDCYFNIIRRTDNFYMLETVEHVSFPTTSEDLNTNGIKNLLSCFMKVKNVCSSLKTKYKQVASKKATRNMASILDNNTPPTTNKISVSPVIYYNLAYPVAQFLDDYQSKDKGKKKRYFDLISRNYILDMTDTSPGSHMSLMPASTKSDFKDTLKNFFIEPPTRIKIAVIDQFENKTSISCTSLKKSLKQFEHCHIRNHQERAIINIYKFILEMHLYEQYNFKTSVVKTFSGQDFIIKFWSYIIERIFSNCGLQLHWGDTQPVKVKRKEDIVMKIDLRILSNLNVNQDLSIAEFAKNAIPSKLYKDELKQALLSKFHLNALLLSGLSPAETYIPVLQIMGFEAHFYIIRMINDVYVLETIGTIIFPTSFEAWKNHTIKKMIDSFLKMKNSCISLRNIIKNNSMDKKNIKMTSILSGKKNQSFNHSIEKMVWKGEDFVEFEEDIEYEDIDYISLVPGICVYIHSVIKFQESQYIL